MSKCKKVLSVFLAVLMLLCIAPLADWSIEANAAAVNDYKQWKQGDAEWNRSEAWPKSQFPNASYRYMRDAGCLVTSIAILLRHHNVISDNNVNNINPWICNESLKKVGAFTDAADLYYGRVTWAYPNLKYQGSMPYSYSNIKSLYEQGYACTIKVYNWHFVALNNVVGNTVNIFDPGYSSRNTIASYSDPLEIFYYKVDSSAPTPPTPPAPSEPTTILYPTSGSTVKIASAVGSDKFLDFALSTNNVQIYENCDGHSNPDFVKSQYFTLTHVGDGWYYITNTGNGLVVDVYNASAADGTNVQQYEYNGSNAQLFRFYDAGSGYCYIKSRLGYYLDVNGGTNANNTNVHIYTFNATNAQKWKINTHTHSYTSSITTNPTCITDGIRTYRCSCGHSYTQNIGKHPATHAGGTTVKYARAATCTTEGYTGDTYCKGCGVCIGYGTYTAKNTNNHTGGTTVKNARAATCTKEGYTGDTHCKGCDAKLSSGKAIAKIPHDHELTATIYPTCTATGLNTFTCYCGDTYDVVIPANGHTSSDWIVHKKETCTTAGVKYKECTVCDVILEIDAIEATGHSNSDWIVDVAPTCTTKGSRHIECETCKVTLETEVLAILPHDYEYVVTDATCETDGYTTVTCPDCGDSYITDVVPAFGHDDADGDTYCDACDYQLTCKHCGRPVHESQTDEYFCIIIMMIKLLTSFLGMVTA